MQTWSNLGQISTDFEQLCYHGNIEKRILSPTVAHIANKQQQDPV